ncbi:hypothetical protein [Catellatospora sp. NPDC049609]|uniref:hypothetical protein n=1 Tax=Catellatospora sp. NPDC049609 TaxID=3155505 RepID=UPI0034310E32
MKSIRRYAVTPALGDHVARIAPALAASLARIAPTLGGHVARIAIGLAVAVPLVFATARPAAAHDGVVPTLHSDGRGSVWLTLAWTDGHPIKEPALALLSGHSAQGGSVAATALRPLPHDPATLPLPGALAAGDWTLTVDVATPGVGYCAAELHVAADGVPQTIACATPPTAAAAPAAPDAEPAPAVIATVAVGTTAALALAGVGLHRALRLRRPTRRPARPAHRR